MARRKRNVLGTFLATLVILILIALIVGAIFEVFIAPASNKIEAKYENDDDVGVTVITGEDPILGLRPGRAIARIVLATYGYSNESLTEDVMTTVQISYRVKNDSEDKTYTAYVIYFDNIKDANTAREGIKEKVKEDDKVAMFRGKTLVVGDEKAVLRYYMVLF